MEHKPTYHFVWRKLHSLTGIIPLGIFLFFHIFLNSFSLKGPDAFDQAAGIMIKLPYLLIIELAIIFIPILYHMIYGLAITWSWDSDLASNPKLTNWTYFFQRVTGILAVIFICAHVYGTTIQIRFLSHTDVSFDYMTLLLSKPSNFIFYVLGLASVVYHFANGLWNFCITWGITVGRNSQRVMGYICFLLGVAVFIAGVNALAGFLHKGITFFNG
jgi:succinate dehydrogenase / fumarate reductase cytochrome b subunit